MIRKYQVIWRRQVIEKHVAQFVVDAMQQGGDVNAITSAMSEIDQLLSVEPKTCGESRGEFERILIVAPLAVTFEIHEDESVVVVLAAPISTEDMELIVEQTKAFQRGKTVEEAKGPFQCVVMRKTDRFRDFTVSRMLCVCCFILLCTSPSGAQTTITWKLKQGDRFFVHKTEDVRQTLTLLGAESFNSVRVEKVVRYDVLSKDKDGNLALNKTVESVKVKYQGGAKHGDHRIIQALKDARFQFTLTPTGEVKNYSGFDAFLKRLNDTGQGQLVPMVKASMSNESLRASDAVLFDITPGKPVSAGDRWEKTPLEPLGPLGSLQLHIFYTLIGKQKADGNVEIAKSSTISYRKPTKVNRDVFPVESGRLSAAHEKGKLRFNVVRGRLHEAEWERGFTGTFTGTMNRKKVSWTVEHQQKVTLRVLDKAPQTK